MERKENSKDRKLLPAYIITEALNGENSAKCRILEYYRGYIIYFIGVSLREKILNPSYIPVEDIVQEVSLEVLEAIKKFK